MKSRTASRLAWVAFGFVALCFVGGLVLSVLNATGPKLQWREIVGSGLVRLAMFAFPAVGVLIASRQPRNAIGWILLAIGLVWELPSAEYVEYGLITDPGSLPRPDLVAVLTSGLWVPVIGLIGTFLLLLFPDGRLPSRRWRPLAWLSGLVLTFLTLVIPILPAPMSEVVVDVALDPSLRNAPNPLGIEALRPVLDRIFVIVLLVPVCIAGCALGLIVRFRRSYGLERLQLKWLAAGAGVTAAIYLAMMAVSFPYEAWSDAAIPLWLELLRGASLFAFLLIPLTIGIAILRYRLYDINVIINRALVYGTLTAALAVIYVGGVIGIGAIVRTLGPQGNNNLAVASSTLAIAGLFGPLRRRVQSFIDRRFYRHKYDAERTLAEFSSRLREQVDLDSLNQELVALVTRTMQPSHVSLWLKRPTP